MPTACKINLAERTESNKIPKKSLMCNLMKELKFEGSNYLSGEEKGVESRNITVNSSRNLPGVVEVGNIGKAYEIFDPNSPRSPNKQDPDPFEYNSGDLFTDTSSLCVRDTTESENIPNANLAQHNNEDEFKPLITQITQQLLTKVQEIDVLRQQLVHKNLQICEIRDQTEITKLKIENKYKLKAEIENTKEEILKQYKREKRTELNETREEISKLEDEINNLKDKLAHCREEGKIEIEKIRKEYDNKFQKVKEDRWKLLTEKEKISIGAKETLTDLEMKLLTLHFELAAKSKEVKILEENFEKMNIYLKIKTRINILVSCVIYYL